MDDHAVSILEDTNPFRRRAYIIGEYAFKFHPVLLIDPAVLLEAYIVVQDPAVVKRQEKGPGHNCTLHFDLLDFNRNVVQTFLQSSNTYYVIYQI